MAPPAIYTLSLHDALPIFDLQARDTLEVLPIASYHRRSLLKRNGGDAQVVLSQATVRFSQSFIARNRRFTEPHRSEEHTSELQSLTNLVCSLMLEKKN